MKNTVELLAPAGSFEALVAAVENGANAVYLGGKAFNARKFADNFDDEKLKEAVEYAHVRGVKIYLTINILLTNSELKELTDFLIYIHSIGIDGVIVQDLGAARFIKSVIPEIKLHASTQMTIHNLEGAKELESLGFERVVLARELNINEVEYICKNTSLEVEIFVHGALCVCYSGQCLMSSIIGERSGNRGACAQPCRLQYQLKSKDGSFQTQTSYLLSPKDLCTVDNIEQILKSGVKSLKIEGRMKRPEYVAAVVQIYRKYIEKYINNGGAEVTKEDFNTLLQVFNRGGFTKGYLFRESGKLIMSWEKPNNWGIYLGKIKEFDEKQMTATITLETSLNIGDSIEFFNLEYGLTVNKLFINKKSALSAQSGETVHIPVSKRLQTGIAVYKTSDPNLLDKLKKSYEGGNLRKVKINGEVDIYLNKPVELKISDDKNVIEIGGDIAAEKAVNIPLTTEKIYEQMNKLGNTPYQFAKLDIQTDNNISIPISEINNVRRKAVEKLTEARINQYTNIVDKKVVFESAEKILEFNKTKKSVSTKLSLYINNLEQLDKDISVDRVYIPITLYLKSPSEFLKLVNVLQEKQSQVYIAMPRIARRDIFDNIKSKFDELVKSGVDGFLATGLGQESLLKEFNLPLAADFSYNVFNNLTMQTLNNKGTDCITLSPELNLGQIKEIIRQTDKCTECIVYGRLPLMIAQFCPVGSTKNKSGTKCGKCGTNQYEITDRLKNSFPIIFETTTCQSTILNARVMFLGSELEKIISAAPDFIRIYATVENKQEVLNIINLHNDFLRYGKRILDNYNEYIEINRAIFTKGHFFRGVE